MISSRKNPLTIVSEIKTRACFIYLYALEALNNDCYEYKAPLEKLYDIMIL